MHINLLSIKKLLVLLLVALFTLNGCLSLTIDPIALTLPRDKLRYSYYGTKYITHLSTNEQQKILEAFDVKIPSSESEAYIQVFGRRSKTEKPFPTEVSYYIEFGGVENYQEFYDNNRHRVGDNGLIGLSNNELFRDGDQSHYLSYSIHYSLRGEEIRNEEKILKDLFNEILENQEERLKEED